MNNSYVFAFIFHSLVRKQKSYVCNRHITGLPKDCFKW